jgi:holo-ACP synthase
MSCVRLQADILAARDAREAVLGQVLARAAGPATVVFVSMAIPGPCKTPPGSDALFGWGLAELTDRFDRVETWVRDWDALGPYAILEATEPADAVKRTCIAIEDSRPAARLLDLDVYDADGTRLGRIGFGVPPRACLLCNHPAVDCMRLHRHSLDRVIDHAHHLLADLLDPAPR